MTALDRRKLGRLLGMLGSQHDGEALTAARLAEALRCSAGVTWGEIVGAELDDAHDLIIRCLDHPELLTNWEINFLHSLRGFVDPSPRQLATLDRIAARVGAR